MATGAQHTPGPWEACDRGDYGDYDGNCVVILGDDLMKRVAVVFSDEDAPVIAAAPEMRTALVAQRAHIQHWLDDVAADLKPTKASLREALASVEDAIAKAEGR